MRRGHLAAFAAGTFGLSVTAFGSETITYSYDAHGQVTAVGHSGSVNNNVQAAYSYDNAFNRTGVLVTGSANAPPAGAMAARAAPVANAASPSASEGGDADAPIDHSRDGPREGRVPRRAEP